uniref:HDC18410 n=1 Tax=Drosophila melanogaster TaxID=7227 RepID=Q6IIF8_DROME|nr:TPA_inf: HDC18410 [Drosophila melanogaster]
MWCFRNPLTYATAQQQHHQQQQQQEQQQGAEHFMPPTLQPLCCNRTVLQSWSYSKQLTIYF